MTSIRFRLRSLRERNNLSQEEVARRLGFKDRQTLSDLEVGIRKISPEELLKAADLFNVSVGFFTDPFELAGEGQFSWRQKNVDPAELDSFETKAGRWLAAYRYLSKLRGQSVNSQLLRVGLDEKSTYEDAQSEGEAISAALNLGEIPAERLAAVMEGELDTLVLYVDTVEGVSGAACQLRQLNAVFINRNEPSSRQTFDLAHEFFHLLTWESMPPKRIEGMNEDKVDRRVEQLAENFAGGLLMPARTIASIVAHTPLPKEDELAEWLVAVSETLKVSPSALMWRLVTLKYITKAAAQRIRDHAAFSVFARPRNMPCKRFSRRFVEVLGWGISSGHVSARRAALLLDTTLDDLSALFSEHGLETPFDL